MRFQRRKGNKQHCLRTSSSNFEEMFRLIQFWRQPFDDYKENEVMGHKTARDQSVNNPSTALVLRMNASNVGGSTEPEQPSVLEVQMIADALLESVLVRGLGGGFLIANLPAEVIDI
ncbi:unnamed protein product [Prunus armeniaca]|uniref:Uncharacterized protein n=1 Tax=Prunus armeniaca TaxID=36596 RepID=A0A6J5YAP0_PRUAR|nr:unnamed protein product [Prunus armeniaca]